MCVKKCILKNIFLWQNYPGNKHHGQAYNNSYGMSHLTSQGNTCISFNKLINFKHEKNVK